MVAVMFFEPICIISFWVVGPTQLCIGLYTVSQNTNLIDELVYYTAANIMQDTYLRQK